MKLCSFDLRIVIQNPTNIFPAIFFILFLFSFIKVQFVKITHFKGISGHEWVNLPIQSGCQLASQSDKLDIYRFRPG